MNDESFDQPLVSISCITYNHAGFIEKALEGFLMQETNFAFEVLIHDDASTDGTEDIIRRFQKAHPNIIKPLYEETNQWLKGRKGSATFNFPRARGKYIALCEGDDYWTDPFKLQKQVDFLEENKSFVGTFHEVQLKRENKGEFDGTYSNLSNDVFSTEDFFGRHIVATCSLVFRRFDDLDLTIPEGVASGDKWMLFLLSLRGDFKFFPDVMGIYRLHDGGVSAMHSGINKVYDMGILLHKFDKISGYQFTQSCKNALRHEIEVHLKVTKSKGKRIHQYTFGELLKEVWRRMLSKIKI